MQTSFCQRIVESFESRADRVGMRIVGSPDEVHTFGEMLRKVRAVAAQLRNHGVQEGDRVVLLAENHPNWAIAYLGTLFAGAVIVPLDPHGEIETLTNFFEDSEAKLAFIDEHQAERFAEISNKLGRDLSAVVWGAGGGNPSGSEGVSGGDRPASDTLPTGRVSAPHIAFERWATAPAPGQITEEFPVAAADTEIAVLMYTSGTTG